MRFEMESAPSAISAWSESDNTLYIQRLIAAPASPLAEYLELFSIDYDPFVSPAKS